MTEDQINRRWVEILLDTLSAEKPVTIGPRDASCFINALRALLATPLPEPRTEVTDEVIAWDRVVGIGLQHGMQWTDEAGWSFANDDPLHAFANDLARFVAARTGASS
ncbi:hypothetical protein ACTJLD_30480 [Burkholderia sp. 22088]|uniref:hypothetical protein n=1 Tax=Burkholderia sp. 22088 TaxID=3453871 RepID=UPI003F877038